MNLFFSRCGLGVCFVLGFALSSVAVDALVPERLKLEWFESIADEVDVVFLGSSHVFRQIDPVIFDQERQLEPGLRAVNLGAPGMTLAEEMYLLERVLAKSTAHLRWCVVEALPAELQMKNAEVNDFGKRRVEWHGFHVSMFLLAEVLRSDQVWAEKWSLFQRHLRHAVMHFFHIGEGSEWLAKTIRGEGLAFSNPSVFGQGRRGYVPLEMSTADENALKQREEFLQDPRLLWGARPHLSKEGDGGPPSPLQSRMVQAMEEMAQERGVRLIWWLHPNLDRLSGWRQLAKAGQIQLIAFDDIERYPQFYKLRWHFDPYHLTRKGAEKMTVLLAHEFQELTQALPQ